MARLRRFCPVGYPVHVIQRGNNRSDCFGDDFDKATYIRHLGEATEKFSVDVHAWVLMSNHVHLLLTPNIPDAISKLMQYIGRQYVRYFNRKYERTGTLWEGRFRSSLVQDGRYFLVCQRYIELNPVRAAMVCGPADYHWSSYHTNALGRQSEICRPHPAYLELGANRICRLQAYRALFYEAMPDDEIQSIRQAVNHGFVFGSDEFIKQVENQSGQRGSLLKRGPRALDRV